MVMTQSQTSAVGVDTMSGSDALLWTISADPVMRPTIVAMMVMGGVPEWHEMRRRIEALTLAVPRLRSCAVERAPGRGRPQFLVDEDFDLDTHVHHIRLPGDGTKRDVLDLAQTMATSGFDTALPLWEAVFIEGVDGDRSAVVMKVHHALIDGVGGLAVLGHLFDETAPQGARSDTAAQGARSDTAARTAGVAPGVAAGADAGMSSPDPAGRSVPGLGLLPDAVRIVDAATDALLHPLRTTGRLAALGSSVARLIAPSGRPVSPLMRGRGFRRTVEVIDLDLEELKAAAREWGGTVNDVFVAAVVRGLARYHEQHGVTAPGFRALMPVYVRGQAGRAGGNHFVPARFVIPVHVDLADCVAEVRHATQAWKHAPGLAVSDVLATGLSALPAPVARGLWGAMLLGNDFCITNVPGPPFAVSLAGVPVQAIYALSPPSGAAFNVALVSSGDRASVTITTDTAAVPDAPKLAACIEDGFAEVCAGRHPPPAGRGTT
jgi:diacylglycerol O-acyltransferase / wax synthase